MTLSPARLRPPVRHNQTVGPDALRAEALAAVEASGRTRSSVADDLDVSAAAVSRALNDKEGSSRYASLLSRIVSLLTDYSVVDETTPTFRFTRKGSSA